MLPPSCALSFEPERRLGEGGYGTVWLARQRKLDRTVVVKVLHAAAAADENQRRRFRDEARVTARLKHPSIVEVVDLDVEGDSPWIAFEYMPGRSLGTRLADEGRLPIADAVDATAQVAGALHAAHQSGVLHRDVKPHNILGGEGGVYKLGDFGIAWFAGHRTLRTEAGVVLGTPAYMAPEHIRGDAEPRSDLYALGCVLFEMLSGQTPVIGFTPLEQLAAHLAPERPELATYRPDAPRGLCVLVGRLIACDPAQRPASGEEVETALRAVKDERAPVRRTARLREPGHAPTGVHARAPRAPRRAAWIALGAGAAIGTLALLVRPGPRRVVSPPASVVTPSPTPASAATEPDDARMPADVEQKLNGIVDGWIGRNDFRAGIEGLLTVDGLVEVGSVAGLSKHADRIIAHDLQALESLEALDAELVAMGDTRGFASPLRVRVLAYRFHWSRRVERLVRASQDPTPARARGAMDLLEPYATCLGDALRRIAKRRGKARARLGGVLQSLVDVRCGVRLMPLPPAEKPLAEVRLKRVEDVVAMVGVPDAEDLAVVARAAWNSGGRPLDALEYRRVSDAAARLDVRFAAEGTRPGAKREWVGTWVEQHLAPRKER